MLMQMKKVENDKITPLTILKEYWGYDSFRSMQEEIVRAALGGRDVLAILPTGGIIHRRSLVADQRNDLFYNIDRFLGVERRINITVGLALGIPLAGSEDHIGQCRCFGCETEDIVHVDLGVAVDISCGRLCHLIHRVDRPLAVINELIGVVQLVLINKILGEVHNDRCAEIEEADIAYCCKLLAVDGVLIVRVLIPPGLRKIKSRDGLEVNEHSVGGEELRQTAVHLHTVGDNILLRQNIFFQNSRRVSVVAGERNQLDIHIQFIFNRTVALDDGIVNGVAVFFFGNEVIVVGHHGVAAFGGFAYNMSAVH